MSGEVGLKSCDLQLIWTPGGSLVRPSEVYPLILILYVQVDADCCYSMKLLFTASIIRLFG